MRKPEFAHEEIVEIEAEFRADVGIRELFVGQFDGEADGFPAGLVRAAVGCFHDAGAAAGADDEAARTRTE